VADEMYVYPAMKKYLPNGDEAVDHDVEEHKELEQTMKKLESVDAHSSEFAQLLGELENTLTLRDHVSDEENEQFPQLRAQVPARN
jgi:Hemerythrin HHE cation binding domain